MVLTLEITGPEAAKLGAGKRKVFRNAGGTIGRGPENEWVLPDPYVSSRHARIRYADGVFYVDDTSRNGMSVNGVGNRLKAGQPYPLKDGDLLWIEPFEIRASIVAEPGDAFLPEDDFLQPAAQAPLLPQHGMSLDPLDDPFASGDVLEDLFRPGPPEPKKVSGPTAGQLGGGSVVSGHYRPPAVVPAQPPAGGPGKLIPDDWEPSFLNVPVPKPQAPQAPPQAPARPTGSPVRPQPGAGARQSVPVAPPVSNPLGGLAEVLAGAGLTNVEVTPELAKNLGEILRVVVSGVMELLQARQRIKDEFGLPATRFARSDNNPLKFSADVEHALRNLLVERGPAFLGPVEAFDDAFDDLRFHQVATLEGVRVAYESMLDRFNPDQLQEAFDRLVKNSLVPAKMRYWELYRERVRDMVSDADDSFRELFGDAFAKAYEKELVRLKAQARAGKV